MASHSISGRQVIGCNVGRADTKGEHPQSSASERSQYIRTAVPSFITLPAAPQAVQRYRQRISRRATGHKLRPLTFGHLFVTLSVAAIWSLLAYLTGGFITWLVLKLSSQAVWWMNWLEWSLISAIILIVLLEASRVLLDRCELLPEDGVSFGRASAHWERRSFREWQDGHQIPLVVYEVVAALALRFPDVRCVVHQLNEQWNGDLQREAVSFLGIELPDRTIMYLAAWSETPNSVEVIDL